ncbi:MAG: hypothetical protein IKX89_02400 [Firmicutes bacterium]|nr:hypothetical protein [Bacillota bacterium]
MWIKVNAHDGPHFTLPVPLSLAGSRFVWSLVAKYGSEEAAAIAPFAAGMVHELRRYVRENGHFTMVDVQSSDGDIIKITV